MPQVLYNAKEVDLSRRFSLVVGLQCVVVAGIVLNWGNTVHWVAEPLEWATSEHASPSGGLLDYPLILAWLLPTLGLVGGWGLRQLGVPALAIPVAVLPTLYLVAVVACYHLLPLLTR